MSDPEEVVLRLLAEALENGDEERWAAAERAVDGAESVELVRDLKRLLALSGADATREGRHGTELGDDNAAPPFVPPEPADPTRVGPFRLIQPLGEGAMGIVYEAEQEAPVRRRVALKVLKFPMPTRQALARFESERQALALMNHPHIAQVYDGGVAPDGRPYLAMEFVRGIPVTEYCDRRRLTIGERLELFVKVCEGVQHAHQKGVIHRDLKPTNILVTEIGGVAVPKVIDFGVAKAIGQQLTEKTLLTHVGHVVGTPAYMSPEQADPTGLDIDTRSDVYALGVLLYELLVGSRPFEERSGAAVSVDEMRRRIVHLDPERPSARAGAVSKSAFRRSRGPGTAPGTGSDAGPVPALGPGTHEAARLRQTEPRELARRLRGELDRVVLKALEKDRNRRYGSAGDLANDVRNVLANRPVSAGAPSRAYRAKKFVLRHRLGVTAASLVVLALVAGILGTSVGLVRARAAQRVAQEEAETARQVSDFLVDLFEVSDPDRARGNRITALEILNVGSDRIARELMGRPLVRARLMETMGRVYRNLGQHERAVALLEEAAASQRAIYGEQDPRSLRTTVLAEVGHEDSDREPDKRLRDLLAMQERILGPDHIDCAWTRYYIASRMMKHAPARARAFLQHALPVFERVDGPHSKGVLWVRNNLAFTYYVEGRFVDALREAELSLALRTAALPENHPDLAVGYLALGESRSALGHPPDELVPVFERALAIARASLGEEHPTTAYCRSSLGDQLLRMNDLNGARRELEAAEAVLLRLLPADHMYVTVQECVLSELYFREGRLELAANTIDRVVANMRKNGMQEDLRRALRVRAQIQAALAARAGAQQ